MNDVPTLAPDAMNLAPIGLFDSGVGGLTVAAEARRLMPSEDLIYYSDEAYCPYGKKTTDELIDRCRFVTETLLERGAKIIVVACNTASGAALADLRSRYPVPFVGLVPAIKPACLASTSGRVGVLATAMTVQGNLFNDVVNQFVGDRRLTVQTCPGLADAIERGDSHTPETRDLLRGYLAPLKAARVDSVVLGCTHYPLVADIVREEMGEGVQLFDSSLAVATQTRRVLVERGFGTWRDQPGSFTLLGSGELGVAERIAGRLGLPVSVAVS